MDAGSCDGSYKVGNHISQDLRSQHSTMSDAAAVVAVPVVVPTNVEALERALEDIKQDLPWLERTEITTKTAIAASADEDLQRETALYVPARAVAGECRVVVGAAPLCREILLCMDQ